VDVGHGDDDHLESPVHCRILPGGTDIRPAERPGLADLPEVTRWRRLRGTDAPRADHAALAGGWASGRLDIGEATAPRCLRRLRGQGRDSTDRGSESGYFR